MHSLAHPAPAGRPTSGLRAARQAPPNQGFTLVELLVALAVVAILAGISYPSYHQQVARSRRADAQQALMELAQRMEQQHFRLGSYAGARLGGRGVYPDTSRAGHYHLAITEATADSYSLLATPRGVQRQDRCGSYTYNHLGDQGVQAAPGAAGSAGAPSDSPQGDARACWP